MQKNSKDFKQYVNSGIFSDGLINNINSIFTKITDYELEIEKSLYNWDKQDVVNFFKEKNKSRGYNALQTKLNACKEIFKFFGVDEKLLDISSIKKVALETDDRYFKLEEVIKFCELNLVNAQDKALIMLLFNGVMGAKYKDICELKKDQIKENKIELEDRVVEVDDYTAEKIKEALDQDFYFKYITANTGSTNEYYTLNKNSEYVFRPKRTTLNDKGASGFKSAGIQRRVMFLSNYFGERITGKSLGISGLMHKLYQIEKEMIAEGSGERITVAFIKNWAKENGYKTQPYELYRYYNMKYEEDIKKLYR